MTSLIIDPGQHKFNVTCSILYTPEHFMNVIAACVGYTVVPLSVPLPGTDLAWDQTPTVSLMFVKNMDDVPGDLMSQMKHGPVFARFAFSLAKKCAEEFEAKYMLERVGGFDVIRLKTEPKRNWLGRKAPEWKLVNHRNVIFGPFLSLQETSQEVYTA